MSEIRKCLPVALAVAALIFAVCGTRADKDENNLPPIQDREFVALSITAAKANVRLCNLALKQADDDKVKNFARKAVKVDGLLIDKFTDASRDMMIGLDYELENVGKAAFTRLAALKGDEFDREFIKLMFEYQTRSVALFERELKSGANPTIKTVAKEGLTDLKSYLKDARAISDGIKDKKE